MLTIDKALEIIKKWGEETEDVEEGDFSEAVQLGVEALKLYQTIKADGLRSKEFRLPGETKD